MGRRLKLHPKSDFVNRLSQASIYEALEELIWNAFDEEAIVVDVRLSRGKLDELTKLEVVDNGRGLEYDNAATAFQNLGESSKVDRTSRTGLPLHGRLGQGRHKAMAVGRTVVWKFAYKTGKRFRSYEITGTSGRGDPFYLGDECEDDKIAASGCHVTITDIRKTFTEIFSQGARAEIAARFAPSLLVHPERELHFNGIRIDPTKALKNKRTICHLEVGHGGKSYDVTIRAFHWNTPQHHREVFLCGSSGISLHRLSDNFHRSGDEGTIFVESCLFDELHNENLLQTFEASQDADRKNIAKRITSKIRSYYQRLRKHRASDAIQKLKDEGSYPYRNRPSSGIETIERRVFDVCAVNVSRNLPSFNDGMEVDGRKLLLRMIKEGVSRNPSNVGRIIREVLRLPNHDAKRFAALLDDMPLSKIVDAAHRVAQRLEFLKLFKAVVYLDPFERTIRERTELQKLLLPNTWLFGEEYAIGTDDEDMKTVLERHVGILRRDALQQTVTDTDCREMISQYNKKKEKTPESLNRIPDFMLWRQFKERRPDEYEFLVVEIKRPGVLVGHKEHQQIEDYAQAIVHSPFADKHRTRWVFVVISDDLDKGIHSRANQTHLPRWTTLSPRDEPFEIRAMPWSAVIQSAEGRHEHLRKWLNHSVGVEQALERSQETYKEFLPQGAYSVSKKQFKPPGK